MTSTSIYAPAPETTAYIDGSGMPTGLAGVLVVFTPSAFCSHRWYYDPKTAGYVWSDNRHDSEWAQCQPYGATVGAYSPGVCPSGQEFKDVVVFTSVDGAGTTATFYDGRCCKSAFTWFSSTTVSTYDGTVTTSIIRACVSEFKPPLTVGVADAQDPEVVVLHSTVTAVGTYLDMFWHESDLSTIPTPLAASLRVAMGLPAFPTSSFATSQIPPATSSSASDGSGADLSKGSVAGVAVGSAVAALLVAFLVFLALLRRWKRKAANETRTEQQALSSPQTPVSGNLGRFSWITRWKKGVIPQSPGGPDTFEMDEGDNTYKAFGGGAWRSELQSDTAQMCPELQGHSRFPSDLSQPRSELHGHSREVSEGSQVDSRGYCYSPGSPTGGRGTASELEGYTPVRQAPIPEAGED